MEEVKVRGKATKKEALALSWYSEALENVNTKLPKQMNKGRKSTPDNNQGGDTIVTSSNTPRVSESQLAGWRTGWEADEKA